MVPMPASGEDARPLSPLPPARPGRVMTVACLGLFVVFLQVTQTIATLTTVQGDLGIAADRLTWIPSAYTLAVASGVLASGAVADRVGHLRLFRLGVAVLGVGSLVLVGAGSLGAVLVGQVVAGVGAAVVLPTSLSLVTQAFPDPQARASAIAAWAASSGAGLAVGPVNAGVMTLGWSWNSVFVLNLVVVVGVLVAATRTPTAAPPTRGPALDPLGMVLGTVAITLAVYAAIEAGRVGLLGTRPLVAAGAGVVALVLFLRWELRHPAPMLDVRLLARRVYSGALLLAATVMFAFVGVTLLQLLWLQEVRGLGVLESALHLQASFAGFIAASVAAGVLLRRGRSPRVLALTGLAVAVAGALLFSFVGPGTAGWAYGPALALFGAGCGLGNAPSTALAVSGLPAGAEGVASGTVNAARQIGAVLGTSVLGSLMTSRFADLLPHQLTARGLSASTAEAVAAAVTGGAAPDRSDGELLALVVPAVARSFTEATTEAVALSAALVAAASVLGAALLRAPGRPR